MSGSPATAADIEAAFADVRSELERDQLNRVRLSEIEERLAAIAEVLERRVGDAEARNGRTPDVVLADLALKNLCDTLGWARLYRKHASYAERRERIGEALWSASGAMERLDGLDGNAGTVGLA